MSATPVLGPLPVLSATATGATPMSAFHRCLTDLGLGYYNLVRLSSVIPPGIGLDAAAGLQTRGRWGDRLSCVYAEQRASTPGEQAWAGIGWVQRHDGGGGLLVEHEGASEGFVSESVTASLKDMVCGDEDAFGPPESVVVGVRCVDAPVCALVIVPFEIAGWATLS